MNAKRTLLLFSLALYAIAVFAGTPSPTSWQDVVKIQSGYIHGRVTPFYTREFLGIPFAAPPVGQLRWQAPQPVQPWGDTIIDTSVFKPACAQLGDSFSSEDCLYLNVYAPLAPHDPHPVPFPVMVFIHGGSYQDGSAKYPTYNATHMLAATSNLIVVTIQYRLNAFGFLGSSTLRDADGSTGNAGFKDQRAALFWVRNNIAAFNGDPSQVTVFGESAGSGSIAAHLVSPKSSTAFDRAILESGPYSSWVGKTLVQSQATFNMLVGLLGCTQNTIPCLYAASTTDILKAVNTISGVAVNKSVDGSIRWCPVADGVELLDHPANLAKAGQFSNFNIPVMLGANKDEGTIFIPSSIPRDLPAAAFPDVVKQAFPDIATQIVNMYPLANYDSPWWAVSHVDGDSAFNCPARRSARWLSAAMPSVYFYFFTHAPVNLAIAQLGAFHGSELIYVFRDPVNMATSETSLSDTIISYWTQFARSGSPNKAGSGLVNWPAYTTKGALNDTNIVLDMTVTTQQGLKSSLCDFWDLFA